MDAPDESPPVEDPDEGGQSIDEIRKSLDLCSTEIANLERALETGDIIGQAKGILMARQSIMADAAFEFSFAPANEVTKSCGTPRRSWSPISPVIHSRQFRHPTEREEKASIATGSNLPFSISDPRLAAAIVDVSPSTPTSSRPGPSRSG